jgi:glutamate racemase
MACRLNLVLTIGLILGIFHLPGKVAQGESPMDSELLAWISHAIRSTDPSIAYSIQTKGLLDNRSALPIGVFDSGIGGLTVLEAILSLDAFDNESLAPKPDGRLDFENEAFIYLADQANMPYGNYPAVGKENFLRELILKDAMFLLGQRYWPSSQALTPAVDKQPVKAMAIACNTATAYGLQDIRKAITAWKLEVPVVGVVEAGARNVSESLRGTSSSKTVAILATVGTCTSQAYPKAIQSAVGLSGNRQPVILQQGSVGLAGAIEGDPAFVAQATSPAQAIHEHLTRDLRGLLDQHLASGSTAPIEMLILGCTHYPLIEAEIQQTLHDFRNLEIDGLFPYRQRIAESVILIDPAELTAKELFRTLARDRIRTTQDKNSLPNVQFFISVASPHVAVESKTDERSFHYDYKYGRSLNRLDVEDAWVVPMTVDVLPSSSRQLIETRLPNVWRMLQRP